jgi:hypothetical protein
MKDLNFAFHSKTSSRSEAIAQTGLSLSGSILSMAMLPAEYCISKAAYVGCLPKREYFDMGMELDFCPCRKLIPYQIIPTAFANSDLRKTRSISHHFFPRKVQNIRHTFVSASESK